MCPPLRRASRMSRIAMISSASDGTPRNPNRARAGRNGFDLLAAGLAQMAMHVDESRGDDQPRTVDCLEPVATRRLVRDPRSNRLDRSVDDENVRDAVERLRRIDHTPASK